MRTSFTADAVNGRHHGRDDTGVGCEHHKPGLEVTEKQKPYAIVYRFSTDFLLEGQTHGFLSFWQSQTFDKNITLMNIKKTKNIRFR